ncbi:MAG: class I SAM-dependent methyltransferase [Rubrivivax sp.]
MGATVSNAATAAAAAPSGAGTALQLKAADRAALAQRLRKLERVFDIPALCREPLSAPLVVDYYENCHDAYRKYHSAEGAVHMALNDADRFDPDGFFGQLRRMERFWSVDGEEPPADLLELAFGQGFNLEYLAARHPQMRCAGIDLTPAHLRIASERLQRAGLPGVQLTLGDFHHLPFADCRFDALFCIEAFCYATDLPLALAEVARVLRPGGRFTLFDGYLPRDPTLLDIDAALAVELVAKGMAIEGLQVLEPLLQTAQAAGLETEHVQALDAEVMPSLRQLERITGHIIRIPWLGRRALARRSPMRGRNILAGYLMRSTVQMGLIGYRQIVLRKAG